MGLDIPTYSIIDYYKTRAEVYKTKHDALRHILDQNTHTDSENFNKVVDNLTQDIMLLLMEDNITTTQVRLDSFYSSIMGQTAAFRDFLESQRFLVAMIRKDYSRSY